MTPAGDQHIWYASICKETIAWGKARKRNMNAHKRNARRYLTHGPTYQALIHTINEPCELLCLQYENFNI